jgi:hypothetical protein
MDRSRDLLDQASELARDLFGMGANRAQDSLGKVASDRRVKGAVKNARGRTRDAASQARKVEASPKLFGIGAAPILLGVLGFIGWKLWGSNRQATPDYYVQPSYMA